MTRWCVVTVVPAQYQLHIATGRLHKHRVTLWMWTNDTWPKILGSPTARDKTWLRTMLLWPTLFWTHSSYRPFSLLLAQSLTGFLTLQNPLHCLSGVQLDRNVCQAIYYYINSIAATTKTRATPTSAFIAYSTHCKPLCSMTSWRPAMCIKIYNCTLPYKCMHTSAHPIHTHIPGSHT